jgi:hypothetical protein
MLKGLQEMVPKLAAAGIPFFLLKVSVQRHRIMGQGAVEDD